MDQSITSQALLSIRNAMEQYQFVEADRIAKSLGITLCANSNPKRDGVNLNCSRGYEADHIVPVCVLRDPLGEINFRCFPTGKNRSSAAEKKFNEWLANQGRTC